MYLNSRKASALMRYLREHHYMKLNEIGTSTFRTPKMQRFIFSKDDLNDEQYKLLKNSYINFTKFVFAVWITAIPLFIFVMHKWPR